MPVEWSIQVCELDGGVLYEESPDAVLRTASIGKILLLIHVATLIDTAQLDPAEPLRRTEIDAVADSGMWQQLSAETLSVADLCQLVGAASDNLATNVLLRRVGLDDVALTASQCGLSNTALFDRVRDHRTPENPWTLSTGTAAELAGLLSRLGRGEIAAPTTSERVLGWLANGFDLSMVAAGWGLDPLAHHTTDRMLRLHHKTGTDDGVRCDIGLLTGPRTTVAYAVLANWDPAGPDMRDAVLARMQEIGRQIRTWAESSGGHENR